MIKKILKTIALCAVFGLSLSSCQEDGNLLVPTDNNSDIITNNIGTTKKNSPTLQGTVPYPNPSDFDECFSVNQANYTHVYQQGNATMCGPCSYVSARKIRNSTYPTAYSNAQTIRDELNGIYGSNNWGLAQLYYRDDGTSKSFSSWLAGNNMWGSGRDNIKTWIRSKISSGKPCVIPALYGATTNTSATGHFYVIVSLYLKNGGTGSVVGVKDVWLNTSTTQYYDYSDLLSSNWANAQKYSGIGSESYSVMSFE